MKTTRRTLLDLTTRSLALAGLARLAAAGHLAAGRVDRASELLAAVDAGQLERVRALLAEDPSLATARDEAGRSAFVRAHLAGHPAIAARLAEELGQLDLIEAVLAQAWEQVEAASAAELAELHPIGGDALWAAARCGVPELYRLRSLGANPNRSHDGGAGTTPVRAAFDVPDPDLAFVTATDVLGNGGSASEPQRGGDGILHAAVRRRDERLVCLAIRKGAVVEARDDAGRTARELASELGWDAGARLLAEHASLVRDHSTSRLAWTASREPARPVALDDVPLERQREVTGRSHFDAKRVGELLTEDPRLVWSFSGDAELAIEACGHTGNRPVIRLHLEHGAPLSLPTAISLGDLDHARFLLDEDPLRVHERGPHDFALLWYAAIGGQDADGGVAAAELLLGRGCPLEQESTGNTCLHWAAFRGRLDLARYLAERGCDLDPVGYKWDPAGQTPLALARSAEREDVARLLEQLGARA